MVLLKSQGQLKLPATSSYQKSLLENLKANEYSFHDSVTLLSSGDDKVYVHTALLINASKLISSVIGEPCICQSNPIIILPPSPPTSLENLRTLFYTGLISNLSKYHARLVVDLAKQLGIDISITENKVDNTDSDAAHIDTYSVFGEKSELRSTLLKIETFVSDIKSGDNVKLSFPKSRIKREASDTKIIEKLHGFEGRVQQEYNTHTVGQYMGPYDQNENLKLSIQLPNTSLDYESYTKFLHSGDECFEFCVKSYEKYDDHIKIDAYEIKAGIDDLEESIDKTGTKYYTCHNGRCKIPCPCPQCCANKEQCTNHKIKHIALFDENQHAISIRSSSSFCLEKSFFQHSYILKYPGIPINCKKCERDLFFHHSYHFEFHELCRFCKQTFYKLRARTEKEHHSLEKKEARYFRTVCPYCDKRFCEPFHAK